MTLITKDLIKSYSGKKVVDKVSLEIERGVIIGLLGPNGAGKTTTFHMIAGLIAPEAGKVFLNGEEISKLPFHKRARKGINYLPQEPSVFRKMSVKENVLTVLENMEPVRAKRKKRARELLERLGIVDLAERKAYTLSAGERRRVEIARALATSPSILLLDEPFSGIDPISVEEIQQILYSLKADRLGIVVTDHNVHETLKVTDYAYLMNGGKVFLKGTPSKIIQDPIAKKFYLGERFQM